MSPCSIRSARNSPARAGDEPDRSRQVSSCYSTTLAVGFCGDDHDEDEDEDEDDEGEGEGEGEGSDIGEREFVQLMG